MSNLPTNPLLLPGTANSGSSMALPSRKSLFRTIFELGAELYNLSEHAVAAATMLPRPTWVRLLLPLLFPLLRAVEPGELVLKVGTRNCFLSTSPGQSSLLPPNLDNKTC